MTDQIADVQQLPPGAIPVTTQLPPDKIKVLAWVSGGADVAIHHFPLIVWRNRSEWWGGLPGKYLDLRQHGWTVTHWHWLPLSALLDGGAK